MKAATKIFRVTSDGDDISIHAAREGGDTYACVTVHLKRISIHAAREGGDPAGCSGCRRAGYFNPRRP